MFKYIAVLLMCVSVPASAFDLSNKETRSVTISGNGEVTVQPDEAKVTLSVETKDRDSDDAMKQNNRIVSKVLEFLQSQMNIQKQHIKTHYIRMYPYQEGRDDNIKTVFVARKSIDVYLKDLSKLQRLLDRSIKLGVTHIDNVEFTSSKMQEHKDAAVLDALEKLKITANNIAGNLNMRLGKALQVNANTNYSNVRPYYANNMKAYDMELGGESSSISPGEIKIRSNVTATFELD